MNRSVILVSLILFIFNSFTYGQKVSEQSTLVHPQFKHAPVRKVGKYHLMMYAGLSARVKDPQGIAAVKLISRDDPDVAKDDDEITVYGVNSGDNTIIYNNSLLSIDIYGVDLPDEQRLNAPHGITANPEGRVLVADTGNDRIVELKDTGILSYVRSFGKKGDAPGEFNSPLDVAMDSQGNFYVVDSGNNRIQIFSSEGMLLNVWGGENNISLNNPVSIEVTDPLERWSYQKVGFAVILNNGGKELLKVSSDGVLLKKISGEDFGYPGAEFAYAALDFYNNIYVTDKSNHVIHKFTSALSHLTTFGGKGKDKNEFIEPRGIAIWRRLGQVIIAEKGTVQYYLIGTDLQGVKIEKLMGGVFITGRVTERSYLKIDIFDSEGNFVRRLNRTGKKYGPGKVTFKWNMMPGKFEQIYKNVDGYKREKEYPIDQKVPPGEYKILLEAKATYSSKKYFADKVELKIEIDADGNIMTLN